MEWFPWFSEYYRSKTLHLTLEQDALYRRLIDYYMESRAPLPDNDQALARICAVDLACFMHASCMLRAFFKSKNGKLFHDFCDNQLDIQDKKSKTRSDISKKAANSRWKKYEQNQDDECIEHSKCMPVTMPQDRTRQDKERKTLSVDFEVFWEAYPKRAGSNPKKPALEKYLKIIAKGESPESILAGLRSYAAALRNEGKENTQFVAQAVTWLNQERWRDKNSTGKPTRETLGYTPLGVGG